MRDQSCWCKWCWQLACQRFTPLQLPGCDGSSSAPQTGQEQGQCLGDVLTDLAALWNLEEMAFLNYGALQSIILGGFLLYLWDHCAMVHWEGFLSPECCCNASKIASFPPFCPMSPVLLPALLPSFQGTERIRPTGAHSQGLCIRNWASMLTGQDRAGRIETWEESCWHTKLTPIMLRFSPCKATKPEVSYSLGQDSSPPIPPKSIHTATPFTNHSLQVVSRG